MLFRYYVLDFVHRRWLIT